MSNSNKNDIKEKVLFKDISNFDDFRNQFQQTIDFVVRNRSVDIDVGNFLKTSGSTFEDNGCQFKINNISPEQSDTNANDVQNLSSAKKEEIKDDVNKNILNEITAGLDDFKKDKLACAKLFFDNLEAFELKIDSAEILWLLEKLTSREHRPSIEDGERYRNKLPEILGRYIKKLIHRSEILQLKKLEQKFFKDSLQALYNCIIKINSTIDNYACPAILCYQHYLRRYTNFKTDFQQFEKTIAQRVHSISSISAQKEIDKSESEVVDDIFVMFIDALDQLNSGDVITSKSPRRKLLRCLLRDTQMKSKDLSLKSKQAIIEFLSKNNFDYLDYHKWNWKEDTDFDFMFKLTIGELDYSDLNLPAKIDNMSEWAGDRDGRLFYPKPINYYNYLIRGGVYSLMGDSSSNIKRELYTLMEKLGLPDRINVVKDCHRSWLNLCWTHYEESNINELLDNTRNVLRALLSHYKSKSKMNSIIADLWETNFQVQINDLCGTDPPQAQEKTAKEIEKLFANVENVFSLGDQPKDVFAVLEILFQKNDADKLKKSIEDDNIFNLFIEQVEQNIKNAIKDTNNNTDLDKFQSLIKTIKNNSVKLSIDVKSDIVKLFLRQDFNHANNLSDAISKLENLFKAIDLNKNISEEKINDGNNKSQKESDDGNKKVDEQKQKNLGERNIDNDSPQNQNAIANNFASDMQNKLSNSLSHIKKEEEPVDITQRNPEFKLELTLSNNQNITLSSNSYQTAIDELRKCSDFCYQICSIKKTIEQKKCTEASDCWKQLCKQFTRWESIKVTLYGWFLFKIAKRFKTNANIKLTSFSPTQHNNSVLETRKENENAEIPNVKQFQNQPNKLNLKSK